MRVLNVVQILDPETVSCPHISCQCLGVLQPSSSLSEAQYTLSLPQRWASPAGAPPALPGRLAGSSCTAGLSAGAWALSGGPAAGPTPQPVPENALPPTSCPATGYMDFARLATRETTGTDLTPIAHQCLSLDGKQLRGDGSSWGEDCVTGKWLERVADSALVGFYHLCGKAGRKQ